MPGILQKTTQSPSTIAGLNIKSGKYTVRFAQGRNEVEEALRLRFRVFNLEMGKGYTRSYFDFLDEDEFDRYCHHLVVVENSTQEVVGTYRLQDVNTAEQGRGFYTASEFAIHLFPSRILLNAIELGRACIEKSHRNSRVLYLLWKGIAQYAQLMGMRYLFGCCSLNTMEAEEAWTVFRQLKRGDHLHPDYHILPSPKFRCLKPDAEAKSDTPVMLPQLFELYLKLGAKVCSPPALDKAFQTTDFLILLDLEQLSTQTKNLFFK
ncbi:GNAT family N-acetyltransferase [Gracilimonas mengyeensis]|uniref:Hemolysin n=1 Tax=Gracilimonas mengyeensis TaxID=1302730 RepID=A0A521AL38_9BACT|nr:GNAT family N-acyltransferase [Gracilimonas mengyeensis]SMO35515.1 Putative hemolysin [Gracilimonas mengyeensis]